MIDDETDVERRVRDHIEKNKDAYVKMGTVDSDTQPTLEQEIRELITDWRKRANESDDDLVGNVEYRMYHERANELSELLE